MQWNSMKTAKFAAAAALLLLSACSERPAVTVASPAEIRQRIAASDAPLLLVHTWATWCGPCREEFPELVEVIRHYRPQGMEVLLISADAPEDTEAVRQFLRDYDSPAGSLIASELSPAFMEAVSPDWAGTLPATFLYAGGSLADAWEGPRDFEHYAVQIDLLMKSVKGATP